MQRNGPGVLRKLQQFKPLKNLGYVKLHDYRETRVQICVNDLFRTRTQITH